MNMRRIQFTTLLAFGVLVLPACPKNDEPTDTSTTLNDEVGTSDTTGGETGDTTGTTTSTSTTADSSGFVPDTPDDANSCDPWLQDCPEGEKCAAYSMGGDTWDANKCVPVNGDGVEGDGCMYDGALLGTDTCAVGHMCYYTTDGVGTCIPQCTGSADAGMCPAGFNCSISNNGSLILCVYDCNPLLQDCAPDGTGCFWDGALFNCDPAGDIPENQPCAYINDCSPGQVCVDAAVVPNCAGSACCAAYCDLTDPVCLIAGTECAAFFDDGTAPPGLETVGFCVLPG